MHDHNSSGFLRRTTNVKEKFLNKDFSHSDNLTWEELQSLNAGEWFLKVRAVLWHMHVHTLVNVSVIFCQLHEILFDFADRSFPFSVQTLRRGEANSQKSDHTLLTSAPRARQAAQHLSDI